MKNGLIKVLAVSAIMFIGFNLIDGGSGEVIRERLNKISTNNFSRVKADEINVSSNDTSSKGINSDLKDKTNTENEKLLLVNKTFGLSKNYVPKDLVVPNIPFSEQSVNEEKQVSEVILKPLENLVNAAKNEGIILLGNSGYRSYKLQQEVFKDSLKNFGREHTNLYVAKAGLSEHQSGLAIDITNEHNYFVKGTVEADWLEENAYKFGFILRYPEGKTNITGIEYEPWHIRYVGEEAAKYIYNNDITLEEYLG